MLAVEAPDAPSAEMIRDTAREILARPDYQLKPLGDADFALLRSIWDTLKWLLSPFSGLFDRLYAISPILAFAYVLTMVLVLVGLVWHIVYTFRVALRSRQEVRGYSGEAGRGLEPGELESHARLAAERQDYISAVRYLFQACLLRLEQRQRHPLRKSATNREYLRRFAGTPAYEPLLCFVDIIDSKWYGQGRCEMSDFEICRRAHAEILLGEGA
jgi:hypothetical protein